jgi:hypothetical protein
MKHSFRLALLVAAAFVAACGGGAKTDSAPSAPSRPGVMAISSNPRSVPAPVPQDFLDASHLAQGAGARSMVVTYTWSALELQPGVYALQDLRNAIQAARDAQQRIYVGVQAINTSRREVPADLASLPFDAAAMQARFRALLDQIVPLFDGRVAYLSIGNEVDVFLGTDSAAWASYQRFYDSAAAYARLRDPSLKVGVTASSAAIEGPAASLLASLNRSSDFIALTYYPLNADFTVRPPSTVTADLQKMLAFSAAKPLVLQEVGYPAAPLLGSSGTAQAAFVRNVFSAWHDAQGRIPLLNFFLMHDVAPAQCDAWGQYYGLANSANFKAYVCSLGLRSADGAPKPAWDALVNAAGDSGLL